MPGVKNCFFFVGRGSLSRRLRCGAPSRHADLPQRDLQERLLARRRRRGDRPAAFVRRSGRTGLQRPDRRTRAVHRVSVLPRRRHAAVQPHVRFRSAITTARRGRSTSTTPGGRSATTTCICLPRRLRRPLDTAPFARPRVRRHLRALVHDRRARLAVAAPRDARLQPHAARARFPSPCAISTG